MNVNNATPVNNSPPKDNASISSSTTPTNDSNRQEVSNKRVKTVEENNNDIVMTDTIRPIELQTLTNDTTTQKTTVVVSLNKSLHAPKNDRNLLATAPNVDHSGANSKTDLSNKGKNKMTDTNQDTFMHEQLDLFNFKGEKTFRLFCPLNHFPNNDNPHEVLNRVRSHFAHKETFKGCFIDTICKISIIVLTFTSDVNKSSLDGTNIGSLKVTFYDFNEENTSNIIQQELTKIFNRSIRFVDIPNSYSTEVQLQKAAYVYVKEKDYKEQIFRIKCFNTTIYAFPQTIRLSCTICGDPTHEYTNCPNKQDPNQRPKALKIDRDQNKKPTINQQIYNQFKSIITTHNRERIIRMDQNKYQNHEQPARFSQPPNYIPNIPDNSTKINHLEQEINALKTQLKTLANENTSLKKELTLVKESITTNTKELLYMKEQLNHVNTKSDIMIQKLDEISLYQNNSSPHITRDEFTNQTNEINITHPNTTLNTNNNIPTERQQKIQVVSLPIYEGQNTTSAPVQYPMEDINSIQGQSELGRIEREYDAKYYDQANEDNTYNYNNMKTQDDNSGLLSRFTSYISSKPLIHTATESAPFDQMNRLGASITPSIRTKKFTIQKQKTQKNRENVKTNHKKRKYDEIEQQSVHNHDTNTLNNESNRQFFNPNFKNIGQFFNPYISFSNEKHNTPCIGIVTHNIRGNFRNKIPDILNTMINNNIHILHICKTHELQAPHHESSKAYRSFSIQKAIHTPNLHSNTEDTTQFHIINNPINDGSRKAGNAIIISDLFYKHIAKIHTILGRYIYLKLTFKNKYQFNIYSFYLPTNSTTNRQNIYNTITDTYKQHSCNKNNTHMYSFLLGDFNNNDVLFNDDQITPVRQDQKTISTYRKKFFELLRDQQYFDVQKKLLTRPPNTYRNYHGEFRIDYIYANSLILD
ncbi:hypothetical protein RclHR1_14870003 [Rhizophagus clarus]|uniref:Endonuclease/exonuclease/phosphatase domain-containing protein n=1 Tax=Rhizophagus clarus TaxID=94130 RepID=A0A2Z6QUG8_9GLOM|nr:hypothetical protein RclHR1_14870003 [Rhizophagus clarus]